jgi:hypothetical protein
MGALCGSKIAGSVELTLEDQNAYFEFVRRNPYSYGDGDWVVWQKGRQVKHVPASEGATLSDVLKGIEGAVFCMRHRVAPAKHWLEEANVLVNNVGRRKSSDGSAVHPSEKPSTASSTPGKQYRLPPPKPSAAPALPPPRAVGGTCSKVQEAPLGPSALEAPTSPVGAPTKSYTKNCMTRQSSPKAPQSEGPFWGPAEDVLKHQRAASIPLEGVFSRGHSQVGLPMIPPNAVVEVSGRPRGSPPLATVRSFGVSHDVLLNVFMRMPDPVAIVRVVSQDLMVEAANAALLRLVVGSIETGLKGACLRTTIAPHLTAAVLPLETPATNAEGASACGEVQLQLMLSDASSRSFRWYAVGVGDDGLWMFAFSDMSREMARQAEAMEAHRSLHNLLTRTFPYPPMRDAVANGLRLPDFEKANVAICALQILPESSSAPPSHGTLAIWTELMDSLAREPVVKLHMGQNVYLAAVGLLHRRDDDEKEAAIVVHTRRCQEFASKALAITMEHYGIQLKAAITVGTVRGCMAGTKMQKLHVYGKPVDEAIESLQKLATAGQIYMQPKTRTLPSPT